MPRVRAAVIVYVGAVPFDPDPRRYERMEYRRCGRSGLKLPLVSLGLWQNFGDARPDAEVDAMLTRAFDLGVTHFDLANNYGPAYGAAETSVAGSSTVAGVHRDELVVSTKAGYDMWDGPYGDGGSRKYMLASLDASLRRMGLEYVDIFYSHRFDPETPLEETMGALDTAVRQGKALYAGISSYPPSRPRRRPGSSTAWVPAAHPPAAVLDVQPVDRARTARHLRPARSGLHRLLPAVPGPAHRPLPGGGARRVAGQPAGHARPSQLDEQILDKVRALNDVAQGRGQTMAQMALAWTSATPG